MTYKFMAFFISHRIGTYETYKLPDKSMNKWDFSDWFKDLSDLFKSHKSVYFYQAVSNQMMWGFANNNK